MYEILINIILIHISIFFFKYYYFFNYKQKIDVFVTTQTKNVMKFLNYNIDSQLFKNVCILEI